MSNQFDVAKVLDSLHEAKTAYEAVPGLRQRINELEAQVTRMTRDGDDLATKLSEVERAKAETEAKLQATREERDQYYFRSEELAEAVAKAASLFGSVAPKAEPVAEPTMTVGEYARNLTMPQGQSASDPTADHTSTTTGPAQGQSDSEGQSASPPISQATLSQSGNDGSSSEHSASNQDGPTPESGIASASPASPEGNVHTIPQSQPANSTIRRYEGEPSWAKPPHMSWQEWKDQGGHVPSWANVA